MNQATFQCSCCGESLHGPPLAWHFNAPDAWWSIPPGDQERRGELFSDQCVIDDEHFFIRGLVEIPIIGSDELFAWGIWVSLSRANFERSCELWQDPRRVDEPDHFGWFCNSVPGYPETLHLKTAVHSRAVGLRPYIELEATDHPLAVEQRNGITTARVRQIAEQMHHHTANPGA
ncbi:MAG: DUF2199 domain-containing protein [Bryobacteraceae bacterium]